MDWNERAGGQDDPGRHGGSESAVAGQDPGSQGECRSRALMLDTSVSWSGEGWHAQVLERPKHQSGWSATIAKGMERTAPRPLEPRSPLPSGLCVRVRVSRRT
jgi:hypothetical protein